MGLPFARRTWRLFLAVLAAAMVVSIVVSAVSYLKLYYQDGAVRINSWFMGLVVGELLMAGLWMVVGACVRASGMAIGGYSILPGV